MGNFRTLILLSFLALVAATGCGPSSRLSGRAHETAGSPGDSAAATGAGTSNARDVDQVLDRIRGNRIIYHTLTAKMKIDFENDKGKQEGITAFLHLQQDSAIWISVSPLLGIELVRILITPDSVKIMNKLNKTVISRGTDFVKQMLHIPADFKTFQDILIGNPLYLSPAVMDFTRSQALVSFNSRDSGVISHYEVFPDDYRLQDLRISDPDTASRRYCDFTYGDYGTTEGRNFSLRRKIIAVDTSVTEVTINYSHVKFDAPVSFPFYVPSDYRAQ